jgi:uncharacterized membrane protein
MALDTFILLACQYDNQEDALADYDAVKLAYTDLGIIDTYDAAVVSKGEDGKVKIVKRHEQPTRDAATGGLVAGLAVGALVGWCSLRRPTSRRTSTGRSSGRRRA